ncbi:MAG: nucleotidyltransferase domain-containing protein [Acidimicrobiia bacterium]|nr:nucleotidyltransferase domain-containing protein [Acidimicrobiia bacterium]
MSDPVLSELTAEIVDILRRHGAVFAYAFGSRVRGRPHAGSDIDIAAYWPGTAPSDWLGVRADLPRSV